MTVSTAILDLHTMYKPISSRRPYRQCTKYGWELSNELSSILVGWFVCGADRLAYKHALWANFPETHNNVIPPLLMLVNTAKPESAEYKFGISYLEERLDKAKGLDVGRTMLIHGFTQVLLHGLTGPEYNFEKQLMAAKEYLCLQTQK